MERERIVYLDYAATAPLCEEAARAMAPYFHAGALGSIAGNANANSLHSPGRAAFAALEDSRRSLAADLGARSDELIFTSGATEADNAAVLGLARAEAARRKQAGAAGAVGGAAGKPKVVTTEIEHPAVLEPARLLAREGFEVVRLRPNRAGRVEPEALQAALDERTVLVSVQLANAEVGTVQPVGQLAALAHGAGALFHTDATQALGKIPVRLDELGVDAASFSAHKVGGPKGMGLLYLKVRTPFQALLTGGGQESGRRSSTQNVAGAAGFAAAVHAAVAGLASESLRLAALREELYEGLAAFPQVVRTVPAPAADVRGRAGADARAGFAPSDPSDPSAAAPVLLPNIVHIMVRGMESETLILRLDARGICVSGGSACSSGSLEPSRVLTALGIPRDLALGALRISFGRFTTHDDIAALLAAFPACVA